MEWGRLLFDPQTKDAVFAAAYAKQCGLASQEEGQVRFLTEILDDF